MEISAGGLTGTNQKCCHHCLWLRPMGLPGQSPILCAGTRLETHANGSSGSTSNGLFTEMSGPPGKCRDNPPNHSTHQPLHQTPLHPTIHTELPTIRATLGSSIAQTWGGAPNPMQTPPNSASALILPLQPPPTPSRNHFSLALVPSPHLTPLPHLLLPPMP